MTEFEQMQIEQLKRIADVLEDINGTLISMGGDIEALGDCGARSRRGTRRGLTFTSCGSAAA